VLVYIDSPANVFASVTATHITMLAIVLAALTYAAYRLLSYICKDECTPCKSSSHGIIHKATRSLVYLLVAGLMFLGIRGGTTESTNNIGTVYYSDNATLNDAAVNPIFSFLYTLANLENFKEEYSFYNEDERKEIFDGLYVQDNSISDTILNTTRPNIVTIILEGMSAGFVEALGGAKDVTPNIGELANESVLFTQCYANSFRTDRGVVSILSGYPSFPKTSVMKDANKCSRLPSLAGSLKEAGYTNTFLYGGDIMFTNMNGYLLFTGYDRLISDKDFTREETATHRWGAGDDITFDRLYETIMEAGNEPWHITYLTLSSHEPWEVPYNRIDDDKVANSFAFTDEMLGKFVERLKVSGKWDNTLIICIADHCVTGYPAGIRQTDKERNHILLMMLGGAINGAKQIDKICNQTDFVATLLAQLQLPTDEFRFSRNILSPGYTSPFAYHCYNNGISLMDSTGYSVYDLTGCKETTAADTGSDSRIRRAKAILQSTYDDFFNL
jgi:phosphoglycerol transferase MdoB-like AlkP superfamily enzyme